GALQRKSQYEADDQRDHEMPIAVQDKQEEIDARTHRARQRGDEEHGPSPAVGTRHRREPPDPSLAHSSQSRISWLPGARGITVLWLSKVKSPTTASSSRASRMPEP